MTEGRFVFQLLPYIAEEQQSQVAQALEKRKELLSRQALPKLWRLVDRLNQRKKAPATVLKKRRKRMLFWGLLNWALGIFALIPSFTDLKELWVVLIAGAICLGTGSGALWRDYRGVLAAVSLPAGAILCFGAIGAWEELGCLLTLGVGELAVAIVALVTRKRRKVKARSEEQMAQTLLRARQELPENIEASVVFTEDSMVMALFQTEESNAVSYPYSEFLCMLETRDLLLAVVGETGLLLQKKELNKGTLTEFRAFLETHVQWVLVEGATEQTTEV